MWPRPRRVLATTATAEAAAGLLLPGDALAHNAVLGVYVCCHMRRECGHGDCAGSATGAHRADDGDAHGAAVECDRHHQGAGAGGTTAHPVPLFIGEADFTATPTPTETTTPPGVLPDEVRKISSSPTGAGAKRTCSTRRRGGDADHAGVGLCAGAINWRGARRRSAGGGARRRQGIF